MSKASVSDQAYDDFDEAAWIGGRTVDEIISDMAAEMDIDTATLRNALQERFGDLEEHAVKTFNNMTKPDNAQN